jgi:hypothetical protein
MMHENLIQKIQFKIHLTYILYSHGLSDKLRFSFNLSLPVRFENFSTIFFNFLSVQVFPATFHAMQKYPSQNLPSQKKKKREN